MIVDFVHDLVCPWCRIGLANLRAAAALRPDDPVTIRFRPYQLNPGMPEQGIAYEKYLSHLAGGGDTAPVIDRVIKAGEVAGVTFNFDRIRKAPNSLSAHVMVAATPELEREKMIDALHKAYFDDGRDIGDRDTLLAIAAENGFDARALGAALSYPDFRKMVGDLADQMRQDGVQGVPFFVLNDAVALSGAYPPAQLAQAMAKAAEIAAQEPQTDVNVAAPADEPVTSGVE